MCLPGTIETVRERVEREGPPTILSRRKLLAAGAGAAAAAALPTRALAGVAAGTTRLVDLTHVFSPSYPVFYGAPRRVTREVLFTVPANGFYGQAWSFWEHSCTHMDAPAHFVANGRTSPELALEELLVPIVVVDISARVARDPDAVVEPGDLVAFEKRHGRIPRGALVAMYSGWESRVGDEAAFQNLGADGLQHFPGWGLAAVQWLAAERDVNAIGVDTASIDRGANAAFDVHYWWLGQDRYGLENLRNLSRIPPRGATAYVGVIPWERGSGGPARVIAAW
jgi:kynurenine formamidase